MGLQPEEWSRYSRHLKLKGFGEEAQNRLKQAHVLLIGAGGLGCPIGLYLAGAGVGTFTLVDHDHIEIHNLHRQIAHKTRDAGGLKVESLARAMRELNPLVTVHERPERMTAENAREQISAADLVIDGTDNYATRYPVADACVLEGKPLVYGAIHQFDAQLSLFVPGAGPCYRCLFPEPPAPDATPSCNDAGVLGVLPGVVGLMMAAEALKYLTHTGQTLVGRLALYSALDQSMRHITLTRDPQCPLCGDAPSISDVDAVALDCQPPPEVALIRASELSHSLTGGAMLLDVRENDEWNAGHLDGALHLPLGKLDPVNTARLPRDRDLIVYCERGIRGRKAVATLNDHGFSRVFNLDGGIRAYRQAMRESDTASAGAGV